MYQPPQKGNWQGRTDPLDGEEGNRWHHVIEMVDLSEPNTSQAKEQHNIAFLGFCSDEGVRRNKGRVGAQAGPASIRKFMANQAVHFVNSRVRLYDAGDVICKGDGLEQAQEMLGKKVSLLLQNNYFPILLGGGHEIAYGHFLGIFDYLSTQKKTVGIINLDAHFDLRNYESQGSSGTPFLQIAKMLDKEPMKFQYLALGIDEASNTKALFNRVQSLGVDWVSSDEIVNDGVEVAYQAIEHMSEKVDQIYLTIDLDVLNGAYAPGVSAPGVIGLKPHAVRQIIKDVLNKKKTVSIDIAELNPLLDVDNRTSRLAAHLIYDIIKNL